MMDTVLPILAGLVCLPLTFLGLRSMFWPVEMSDAMSLTPRDAVGRNTVRGVLGGLFLSCVLMVCLGIVTREPTWFLAVALLMSVIVVGRLIGIVLDGPQKAVVPPLVVEIVICAVLVGNSI